jgi:hypothetical protein
MVDIEVRVVHVQILQVGFIRVSSMQFKYPLVLGKQDYL